jgi:hypothetical protein
MTEVTETKVAASAAAVTANLIDDILGWRS